MMRKLTYVDYPIVRYNFSPNAGWLKTITSQIAYIALHTRLGRLSPWSRIRSWTTMRNLWDLLHLLWLGFVKDLLGSELFLCALEEHPQLSLDDALLLLWREMRLTNKLLRRDCNVKKFSDNNDYPTLHSLVKGSQCKSIFMWLSRRSSQRLIPSQASELQRLRATALWSLRRFVDVCDSGGLFLTVEATTDACSAGWLFLRSYQKLAASTFTQQLALYKLRPKLHFFGHLLLDLQQSRENPKIYELFAQEDFMQKVRLMGRSRHSTEMHNTIHQRWCIFYAHRWHSKTTPLFSRRRGFRHRVRKRFMKA